MRERHSGMFGLRYPIYCDIQYDLYELAAQKLKKARLDGVIFDQALNQFLNYEHRHIIQKPRGFRYSEKFRCPEGYEEVLKEIVGKILRGKDLTPYLSTKLMDISYNDDLLNEWNIYHLHLSRRPGDNGFVKRSDFLLLVYVTDKTVYFIKTVRHSEENWEYKKDILEIVDNEWPELIKHYQLGEGFSVDEDINESVIKQARHNHIETIITVNGKCYFGPGGGMMSNGLSTKVLTESDYLWLQCGIIEKGIGENVEGICSEISKMTGEDVKSLHLRLKSIDHSKMVISETFYRNISIEWPLSGGLIKLIKLV